MDHGMHLHRMIRWTPDGFTWDADEKYSKIIVDELGLAGRAGVETPASNATGEGVQDRDEPLNAQDTAKFRLLADTLLHLSLDRPSVQLAISQVVEGMHSPTTLHWLRLQRVARYIAKYPKETYLYSSQSVPPRLEVYCDADWATCKATRLNFRNVHQAWQTFAGLIMRQAISYCFEFR